jgi:hypothetical protein
MTLPLKVLVDVGVGKAVEVWFRQAGHDLAAVRDRNDFALWRRLADEDGAFLLKSPTLTL